MDELREGRRRTRHEHGGCDELDAASGACLEGGFAAYDIVDQLPDDLPEVKYPRTPATSPTGAENRTTPGTARRKIQGAADGQAQGQEGRVKDNVCVAGVPMMNGASTLEGYVPDVDATVVTRILDAGGTIVGKTHLRILLLLRRQPHQRAGAGAQPAHAWAIGRRLVLGQRRRWWRRRGRMAIGGDQGGSIRMPASFCGIYGMKPTHGLVPYTGVMPIETDARPHRADDRDRRRQRADAGGAGRRRRARSAAVRRRKPCTLTEGARAGRPGLKIGVVKEGFGHRQSRGGRRRRCGRRPSAARAGRHGRARSRSRGTAIGAGDLDCRSRVEGATGADDARQRLRLQWKGLYVTSLLDFHAQRAQPRRRASDTLKISMLSAQYMSTIIAAVTTPRRRTSRASCARPTTRRWRSTICC